MVRRAKLHGLRAGLVILLSVNLFACYSPEVSTAGRASEVKDQGTPSPPMVSQSPRGAQRTPENRAQTQDPPKLPAEQVKTLIEKGFGGLFRLDEQTVTPHYLTGDFNGDGVADLCVVARLGHDLDAGDKSSPTFMLYAPLGAGMDARKYEHKFTLGDLSHYADDMLLVIMHGARERGWEGNEPSQKFALLSAMDAGVNRMSLHKGALKPASIGDADEDLPPPRLKGDAILITYRGEGTAIYWDGARYRWYPFAEATR